MTNFPQVVGILNVTPDSFSDGGEHYQGDKAVDFALKMIDHGADIIDIGGESTKPGAESIDTETEIQRVIPVIKKIKNIQPQIKISVDTTKYEVARTALDLGCNMINDVSCLRKQPRLAELAGQYDVPIILMHSRENPKTMQQSPHYNNLWDELLGELRTSIESAKKSGATKIIADPGIGFAKSFENNLEILKNFDRLYQLNVPLLLGLSRKSFIGKMLGIDVPSERDFATVIIHSLLLKYKIEYIRVHNTGMTRQLKMICEALD
ncbi:MAG: dihydropteroate synthase [Candidatus Kapabacteria bacterium]|nr:dihydropteroate synthase [Candidatus Kapabacteria bacterium]